jgi:hypothetical protein
MKEFGQGDYVVTHTVAAGWMLSLPNTPVLNQSISKYVRARREESADVRTKLGNVVEN